MNAVEFADGIDVGNKLIYVRELADYFDLKILVWLGDSNAIVLGKAFEEMNTLMDQTIPGFPLSKLKPSVAERTPLPMKHRAAIVSAEISTKCLFKAPTEDHCGPCFLLTPAVQVAMTIAPRTAQVLGDLRVTKEHRGQPPSGPRYWRYRRVLPTPIPAQTQRDPSKSAR